jgi:hypothetical protein
MYDAIACFNFGAIQGAIAKRIRAAAREAKLSRKRYAARAVFFP